MADKVLITVLSGCQDKMLKYEVIIYWNHQYNHFIAEVPELPGCMSEGLSYDETIKNVSIIMREWIETALEEGLPIPEPRGRLMFA